jgi:serine phosphatase RsbU (regulator of sigma subunit)/ActR/RegA family two-component response regulator
MSGEMVLIVEDETLVGIELKEDLERNGYLVSDVLSYGEDVMPAVMKQRPDIALIDIHLEGNMDGIEAAAILKGQFGIPLIYITAYSDPRTLSRAAATNPEAYLLKPFSERELAANVTLALAKALARGDRGVVEHGEEKENLLLKTSAQEANEAFAQLLPGPDAAGTNFRVGGFLVPCLSGSGDLFDVFRIDPQIFAFYSLDVMGHGGLPTLMAYSLHEVVRFISYDVKHSLGTVAPSEIVSRLNDRYNDSFAERLAPFFTIVYGVVDSVNGAFRFVRAGHPPVIILPAQGNARSSYPVGSAVGAFDNFDLEEGRGVLGPGDRLLVFSDGFLESMAGIDLSDSLARLRSLAEANRNAALETFVETMRKYALAYIPKSGRDDLSLLVIERRKN